MTDAATEIAHAAARLVVEEGADFGAAKRRALRSLGLPARTPLPGNEQLEDAVRAYLSVFCADTQPQELRALRELALTWMERLQEFRPYLEGAVWHGWATRLSDIQLALFCDDPKSAEITLINQGIAYESGAVAGLHGEPVEVLSFSCACPALGEQIGVHLLIYDLDDLRGALRAGARRRLPRGNASALRLLLQPTPESTTT